MRVVKGGLLNVSLVTCVKCEVGEGKVCEGRVCEV